MLGCILQREVPVMKLLNNIFKHQKLVMWLCRSDKQWCQCHQGEPQDVWQPRADPQQSCHPGTGLGWLILDGLFSFILSSQIPPSRIKRFNSAGQLCSSHSHTMDDTGLLCKKKKCVKKRIKERRNLINTPLSPVYIMQNLAWNLYLT